VALEKRTETRICCEPLRRKKDDPQPSIFKITSGKMVLNIEFCALHLQVEKAYSADETTMAVDSNSPQIRVSAVAPPT